MIHSSYQTFYQTSEQEIKFWEWLSSKLPWATEYWLCLALAITRKAASYTCHSQLILWQEGQFPGTWELVMWNLSKQSNTICCIYVLVQKKGLQERALKTLHVCVCLFVLPPSIVFTAGCTIVASYIPQQCLRDHPHTPHDGRITNAHNRACSYTSEWIFSHESRTTRVMLVASFPGARKENTLERG